MSWRSMRTIYYYSPKSVWSEKSLCVRTCSGGNPSILLREIMKTYSNGGGHEPRSLGRNPVQVAALDLRHERVAAQAGDGGRHTGAAAALLVRRRRRFGIDQLGQVPVAEAMDRVLAVEHGLKDGAVVRADRLQPGNVLATGSVRSTQVALRSSSRAPVPDRCC